MDIAESTRCHLYIDSVRDDIAECEQQLSAKREEIAEALKQSEDRTIDAATLKVRMKELELDEEVLKQSEELAIKERVLAEKRLMEVGGYERAVRVLQKALLDAKQELQNTKGTVRTQRGGLNKGCVRAFLVLRPAPRACVCVKERKHSEISPCPCLRIVLVRADEKAHIMSEEKKLHHELVQLNMILHKSRTASVKLQQECAAAMKSKQETDGKLERLSMFLQKPAESFSTRPRSPSKLGPNEADSASSPTVPPPSPTRQPVSTKESSSSHSLSPLPSPSSIRSKLSKWSASRSPSTTKLSPTSSSSTVSLSVDSSPIAGGVGE